MSPLSSRRSSNADSKDKVVQLLDFKGTPLESGESDSDEESEEGKSQLIVIRI
jgi:hypothetical protein